MLLEYWRFAISKESSHSTHISRWLNNNFPLHNETIPMSSKQLLKHLSLTMLPCSKEKAIDPGLCFIYKMRFSGEKTEDMKCSKIWSKWLHLKEEAALWRKVKCSKYLKNKETSTWVSELLWSELFLTAVKIEAQARGNLPQQNKTKSWEVTAEFYMVYTWGTEWR